MKGSMSSQDIQHKLNAALLEAVSNVMRNNTVSVESNADLKTAVDQLRGEIDSLAEYVARMAGEASSAIYELENVDTSEVTYALDKLAELLDPPTDNNS